MSSAEKSLVRIVMGSKSDAETMEQCRKILEEFSIPHEARVLSAHRTPSQAVEWISEAKDAGVKIIIAAAGVAAHLAGVCAAHTNLPVIGVPMDGGPLNGFDALLSTVQMPKGTPVATVAIGKAGAINAGLFAVRILALSDSALGQKLDEYQKATVDEILQIRL